MVLLICCCCCCTAAAQVGTIFLWVYWPSFNGGTAATGDGQQRAFINTYLSLCACTVATFFMSAGTNPKRQVTTRCSG